jgi:hypothetical protein
MNYDQFRQECLDWREREGNGQAKLESILHDIAGTRDMSSVDGEHYDAIAAALKKAMGFASGASASTPKTIDAKAIYDRWNNRKCVATVGRVAPSDDGDDS